MELGDAALNGEVLLPQSVFPSGSYGGTEADLEGVLRLLCARMSVPVDALQIELGDDPDVPKPDPRVPIASQSTGPPATIRAMN